MKKLLLLLGAGMMLVVSAGCMYTSFTSDPSGKMYLTRANFNGFWTTAYICEPADGKVNCKLVPMMGAGGGEAAAEEPAAAAEEGAAEAGEEAEAAAEEGAAEGEAAVEEGGE